MSDFDAGNFVMKYFIPCELFLLLLSSQLHAQDTYRIEGIVLDENEMALPGANVYFPEIEKGGITDIEGLFVIAGLPGGRFILQVSFMGFETHVTNIQVGADLDLIEVSLYPATITAGEVVISGGRHSTQHENAIKIELLKGSELKSVGSPTLIESLAELPNVSCKVSGLGMFNQNWTTNELRPIVLDTIEIFGIERVMFGSNFPVDKLYRSYDELWSAYIQITSAFSKQEREKLFSDNARQFYHIAD